MTEREDAESKNSGEKLLTVTKKVFELFAKVHDGTLMHCRLQRQIEPVKTRVKILFAVGGTVANAKTARFCRRILKQTLRSEHSFASQKSNRLIIKPNAHSGEPCCGDANLLGRKAKRAVALSSECYDTRTATPKCACLSENCLFDTDGGAKLC